MSEVIPRLKQITHFHETLLMNKLEFGLKLFLDWGLLSIGAWSNVSGATADGFGGVYSVLRRVDDPQHTDGTVYESGRKDWCWESDIDYVDINSATQNPTSPATVYVNGSPVTPEYINYPLGRVVFSSAISSASAVTATYSYRNVQTYIADSLPWWQELQYRSFRLEDTHFDQTDDGFWSIGSQHRIQMPCIVIESVPRSISSGYQLGDGAAVVEQDVLCHVLSENRHYRNKLVDILRALFDNTIFLIDNDAAAVAGDVALDGNGDISDSTLHYKNLIDQSTGYREIDGRCRISRTQSAEIISLNPKLYQGVVRLTCEVILND